MKYILRVEVTIEENPLKIEGQALADLVADIIEESNEFDTVDVFIT